MAEHAEGSERPTFFPDASGDGSITPLDALLVINYLNGDGIDVGEGEGNADGTLTANAVLAAGGQLEAFRAPSRLAYRSHSFTNTSSFLSLKESNNPPSLHLQGVDFAGCEVFKADPESTLIAYSSSPGKKRPLEKIEPRTIVVKPGGKPGEFINGPDNPVKVP